MGESTNHTDIKYLKRIMNEKEKKYLTRFNALENKLKVAIKNQKESTNTAFKSSEQAITKAEAAQTQYNISHNGLLRKIDDQAKEFISKAVYEEKHDTLIEKIESGMKSKLLLTIIQIIIGIISIINLVLYIKK